MNNRRLKKIAARSYLSLVALSLAGLFAHIAWKHWTQTEAVLVGFLFMGALVAFFRALLWALDTLAEAE
jgi:hypothetical protein